MLRLRWVRLVPGLLVACLALVGPSPAASQATPYVHASDRTYDDLSVLVMAGLAPAVTRTRGLLSRMAFARMVTTAKERVQARPGTTSPRLMESLARLEETFAPEIAMLSGVTDNAPVTPREVSVELTGASSPARPIPQSYAGFSSIEGTVNPLLDRDFGRKLADGWTLSTEGMVDLTLGRHLTAQVRPRVSASDGSAEGTGGDVTLATGYVRALLGNVALEVGRNSVPHGPARSYGASVSSNPRAFDLVRLSLERPGRLPWIFRHLGPTDIAAYVADMGADRDFPRSKLIVFESSITPHPNVQLGGILLNHQGGEGGPSASFWGRVKDILFLERRRFLPFEGVPQISDKAFGADVRVRVPSLRSQFYVEFMSTDDHNLFSSVSAGLWKNAAWTAGGRTDGLGRDGRVGLWAEWSSVGVVAYTHFQYTSGMTLDRRVLGNPMGPLGAGIQGGGTWTGREHTVALSGAVERYSGDRYTFDEKKRTAVLLSDNPDEIRLRTTLEWTRRPDVAGLRTSVKVGYEHVTRFDFTDGNRNNFLVQVSAGYSWN